MVPKKCKKNGCYSDAVCKDGRCPIHTYADKEIDSYGERGSSPKSNKLYLGVELECWTTSPLIFKAMRAQPIHPSSDSSINHYGAEYKFCYPYERCILNVPRFAERLSNLGAKVDLSCGMHVHLDSRQVSYARKKSFLHWLRSWQDWWYKLVPPSRRSGGNRHRYCRTMTETNIYDHYTWANMMHDHTIEIRIHPGTLNKHKITGWLSAMSGLLLLLNDPSREYPPVDPITGPTPEQMDLIFQFQAGKQYLLDRLACGGCLGTSILTSNNGLLEEVEDASIVE